MNVSHYHILCLLEKSRFTHKSAQKITGNGNDHIIEHVVSKKTLQKCSCYQCPALKILAFGRVQLCRDKDCASYCLAKIPDVTVNTLCLAGLGFFYSETNTDATLWDCNQSSHHNRQAQRQVHKIHKTEAVHLDLTLFFHRWKVGVQIFYKILEILIVLNTL